jgi:hypothetical protein
MTDVQLSPALVVWGDFGCPWSALIGLRVDGMRARGAVEVDWRAVQFRPDLPPEGAPPDEALTAAFDDVLRAASPAERPWLRLPSRRPNTAEPNLRLAGMDPWAQPAARSRLFEVLWHDDLDIGSPAVLELIQLPGMPPARAAEPVARRWQADWEELGGPNPALRNGDEELYRGGPACLDLLEKLR